jgi:hypothetical protein
MRGVLHYLAGGLALAAIVMHVIAMYLSTEQLDPERGTGDRMTAMFFPWNAKSADFTGTGWRWRVRTRVAFVAIIPLALLWAITG